MKFDVSVDNGSGSVKAVGYKSPPKL